MNKKVLISIIILAIAVLLWWVFASKPAMAPTDSATTEFSQDLSGLDSVDLNTDLQSLDADINAL